jgi:hypothetical protein
LRDFGGPGDANGHIVSALYPRITTRHIIKDSKRCTLCNSSGNFAIFRLKARLRIWRSLWVLVSKMFTEHSVDKLMRRHQAWPGSSFINT